MRSYQRDFNVNAASVTIRNYAEHGRGAEYVDGIGGPAVTADPSAAPGMDLTRG